MIFCTVGFYPETQMFDSPYNTTLKYNVQFQRKTHTHPMEGHCKFLGGGRVLKVKILEAKYELPAKLEFPGGTGVGKQKPFHGGGWIFFWNYTFNVPPNSFHWWSHLGISSTYSKFRISLWFLLAYWLKFCLCKSLPSEPVIVIDLGGR